MVGRKRGAKGGDLFPSETPQDSLPKASRSNTYRLRLETYTFRAQNVYVLIMKGIPFARQPYFS